MVDGTVMCPYCGEAIDIEVDEGDDPAEVHVEECQVCRRPMRVGIARDEEGDAFVTVGRGDG